MSSKAASSPPEKAADFPLTAAQMVEDLIALERSNIDPSIFASAMAFSKAADAAQLDSTSDFLSSIRDKSDEDIRKFVVGAFESSYLSGGSARSSPDAVSYYIGAMRWMSNELKQNMEETKNDITETRKHIADSLRQHGGSPAAASSGSQGVDGWEDDEDQLK